MVIIDKQKRSRGPGAASGFQPGGTRFLGTKNYKNRYKNSTRKSVFLFTQSVYYYRAKRAKMISPPPEHFRPPPWPNFATFFVPNTQLSTNKIERRGTKWVWYNFFTFLKIYVSYFSSIGIPTLMFLCYFIIQVQSYNLNREN